MDKKKRTVVGKRVMVINDTASFVLSFDPITLLLLSYRSLARFLNTKNKRRINRITFISIIININMAFDIGKSAPSRINFASTKVEIATIAIIKAIIINSFLRLFISSADKKDVGFLNLDLFVIL
jgi:hypothetical protein